MIVPDTCVEGPPPTVGGGNVDDVSATVTYILSEESGPDTVTVMTKLLVTSGTVHSKHTSLQ